MSEQMNEPWRVEVRNVPIADTGDYEGVVEIFAADQKRPVLQLWGDDEQDEIFARRIVACVNACEGIPTEALAAGVLHGVGDQLQQRDELLAALVGMVQEPQPLGIDRESYKTAIALVIKHHDDVDNPEAWAARRVAA